MANGTEIFFFSRLSHTYTRHAYLSAMTEVNACYERTAEARSFIEALLK